MITTDRLTFRGAKAGVPGNQRDPDDPDQLAQETVLEPTANGLQVGANDTLFDGLVFSGSTGYGLFTSGLVGGDKKTGYKIRNNIFISNQTGIYLRDGLYEVSISDNLFVRNGLKGENPRAGHLRGRLRRRRHDLPQRVPRERAIGLGGAHQRWQGG